MPPSLRIFALPLTRPAKGNPPTIYWLVSQQFPKAKDGTGRTGQQLIWKDPKTWPSGAVSKASELWLTWGEKPTYKDKKNKTWSERATEWKYWTWLKGESLMDTVEWEE